MKNIPRRLYKYRPFDERTLTLLVADQIYSADPNTFNDPLDTRPSLDADLDVEKLAVILRQFVEHRTTAEMKAAAQTIRYGGPKTMEHIARYSQKQAHEVIAEFSYQASNPEYPDEQEALCNYLAGGIETELLRQYDKGVFSLAEREDCPVMWSHYGGQHYGICIGYSVPEDAINDVHEVRYGGSRLVKASTIEAMLDGSASARNDVDRAVLLRKAARWSYEREWRLIGKRGLGSSPLELKEVIFGVRCDDSIKFSVATALERRSKTVKMYEIQEVRDSFELKKRRLDDQLFFEFPRRSRDWIDDFDPLPKLTC